MSDTKPKPLNFYTDEELISEAKSLYAMIYVAECFNASDHLRYEAACEALALRGYVINETNMIEIEKDDNE